MQRVNRIKQGTYLVITDKAFVAVVVGLFDVVLVHSKFFKLNQNRNQEVSSENCNKSNGGRNREGYI